MRIPSYIKLSVKFGAAVSGLLASIMLFYSLTVVSSPFKPIVTTANVYLCFNGKLLTAGYGGPLVLSPDACPGWAEARAAALVASEHQSFIPWGLGLLILSFVLQGADILMVALVERHPIGS